ncbi:GMC family oxidoreductase [Scytonema hofmannii FACHB-248]|uniref:GMC family oxidoreductase n=1 Tax=Scytonema hofmannii FACHB-248 TaxID=1842502 RepID=A0ABR8GKP6_9CYAN|nr:MULTISPECIES: GMC family oxidoreductase [Nostocales]MBD2603749.1 GMC family oxidoreductase [Scytonema hofmannii FACHB-248]
MLIDSRNLPADEVIETEVCIVGAGPAGITLARELIGQDFRVCLLESGDLEFNQETQSLSEGETVGEPFSNLQDMRHRQFGGHANVWNIEINKPQLGLRHMALHAIDFEKRDCVPYSGWAFSKSHLDPFYERAHTVCKLGSFTYEASAWEDAKSPQLPFIGDRVTTEMFQFGPRDIFTNEYRKEISQSPNVTTYLNANVVEIETDETAKNVKSVRLACLQGNKFSVVAKIFILATNGIENARLLLLSNQTQKTGLANQNDVVGRFFMDHPLIRSGMFYPSTRKIFNSTALYDLRRVNNVPVMGKLRLSEEVMRREQLLNMSFMLFPRDDKHRSPAKASMKTLVSSIRQKKIPKNVFQHLGNVIMNVDDLVVDWYKYHLKKQYLFPDLSHGGWSDRKGNEDKYVKFELVSQTEQVPNPDNRVTLGTKIDKLGCPQAKLIYHWSEIDTSSIKRSQAILAEEIARSGLGELQIERDGELPDVMSFSTHHNMGTTRMHIDPKQGVVDANCQVHGISNLFITGTSVFTTGGYGNPTLTVIALAIRLADRVKTQFAAKSENVTTNVIQTSTVTNK